MKLAIAPLLACCAGLTAVEPPGTVTCSWVANSGNGSAAMGYLQNAIDEIEVAPDGTVLTASGWDEGGRCSALYRDGRQVADRWFKQFDGRGGHNAWGWGTANSAVALDGDTVWLVNTDQQLLRFRTVLTSGPTHQGQLDGVGTVIGLAARAGTVVAVRDDGVIVVIDGEAMSERSRFTLAGARDVAIAADGSLWLLVGTSIVHRTAAGADLPGVISDAGTPSSVAVAPDGSLVVCDDGPRQQVLVYDVSASPRLARRIGAAGGVAASKGRAGDAVLWGLRGANLDADGNCTVALDIGGMLAAGTAIKSFRPDGTLRWQMHSLAFVNCFDVDPESDGSILYGLSSIVGFDPAQPEPSTLRAITLDHYAAGVDPRTSDPGAGITFRRLGGRRTLFGFGQMGGGPDLWSFPAADSDLAVPSPGGFSAMEGWAWHVDAEGSVWSGDGPGDVIRRWRFTGWGAPGSVPYDVAHPEIFPAPAGFDTICRVLYDPVTDTLYVSGDTDAKPERSWGLIGRELVRIDGFTAGTRRERWRIDTPEDGERLSPKCIERAGGYLFTVQVKPTNDISALVTIVNAETGATVGTMAPGPTVGGTSGWVDMTHGLRAFQRRDGTYQIVVEEDYRAKNLVYLWNPAGSAALPVITTQPVAMTVAVGQAASFAVVASGSGPMTYQWLRNGDPIVGANAAGLTLTAAVLGDGGALYSVTVTNSVGSATSVAVPLTVTTAPGLSSRFASGNGDAGDSKSCGFGNGFILLTISLAACCARWR